MTKKPADKTNKLLLELDWLLNYDIEEYKCLDKARKFVAKELKKYEKKNS